MTGELVASEEDGRLLSARIADEIRRAVLRGEMRPGMRVRQELLASEFGASRIPVREALQQLQNEGLVVMAPNRGAWIADVNSEESIEVYKIREVVEPLAIFESARYRGTPRALYTMNQGLRSPVSSSGGGKSAWFGVLILYRSPLLRIRTNGTKGVACSCSSRNNRSITFNIFLRNICVRTQGLKR